MLANRSDWSWLAACCTGSAAEREVRTWADQNLYKEYVMENSFHFICPQCGMELPPAGDICPYCKTDVSEVKRQEIKRFYNELPYHVLLMVVSAIIVGVAMMNCGGILRFILNIGG